VSLLTGDKDADYFLFDELERPVRFMIWDVYARMTFRNFRSDVLSTPGMATLPAVAEYLIKMMKDEPGLCGERIIAQLSREYSEDIAEIVAKWEESNAARGYAPGTTFIDMLGKSTASVLPRLMQFDK
jgi:hypothetical protein